jgi:hypothetical protein
LLVLAIAPEWQQSSETADEADVERIAHQYGREPDELRAEAEALLGTFARYRPEGGK